MRIERLDETTRKNLLEDLLKRSPNSYGTYEASVREILDEVKNRRDEAVFAYTEKFDGAALNADNIQVTEEEIQKAYSQSDVASKGWCVCTGRKGCLSVFCSDEYRSRKSGWCG